jgi:hypothetical protein
MDEIQKVYNHRNEIVNLFTSKSVMRSRGQNIILFYTHNGSKTNKYFFEINNKQYEFTNDSIEYSPDILQLNNERGSEQYKQELKSHIKILVEKMDGLDIRDIKGDLSDVGIDLKIYMKDLKGVVLYISNVNKVTTPFWKKYISSMKKLDDNWYYTMNEQ